MSNPKDLGNTIAKLRKQAGYSQKQLAEALNITDKAVSKWERGLSCPDISLLPKLSAILDYDIEPLLSGISTFYSNNWKGILDLTTVKIPVDMIIYDKPMVYYLLSYFMLVNITDITIICNDIEKKSIENLLSITRLPLKISFYENKKNFISGQINVMLIQNAYFLFAASLTRQLQSFMSSPQEVIQIFQSNGTETDIFFIKNCTEKQLNMVKEKKHFSILKKQFGRGTICVQFDSYDNINDISSFVKMFQNQHNQKIADLTELSKIRALK